MTKKIKFTGFDGKKYTFKTKTNELNGNQMFTIDDWRTCYTSDKRKVNQIIKGLLKDNNGKQDNES